MRVWVGKVGVFLCECDGCVYLCGCDICVYLCRCDWGCMCACVCVPVWV